MVELDQDHRAVNAVVVDRIIVRSRRSTRSTCRRDAFHIGHVDARMALPQIPDVKANQLEQLLFLAAEKDDPRTPA